jgi:hypothetical protein
LATTTTTVNLQKVLIGNPNIEYIDATLSGGTGLNGPFKFTSKLKQPLGGIITIKKSSYASAGETFSWSAGTGVASANTPQQIFVYSTVTGSQSRISLVNVGYQI